LNDPPSRCVLGGEGSESGSKEELHDNLFLWNYWMIVILLTARYLWLIEDGLLLCLFERDLGIEDEVKKFMAKVSAQVGQFSVSRGIYIRGGISTPSVPIRFANRPQKRLG
jgi:hypothetical protein